VALLTNLRKLSTLAPAAWPAHTRRARSAGASDAELGETILVAGALRAGGAIAHGAQCLRDGA
jgi:alkylhydroperoxidase/carboxymuconolactone decarboxylase family protein YurZ